MSSYSSIHLLFCRLVKTNIGELEDRAREWKTIRVGATTDPDRCKREYEHDGYAGTMYYAATQNMKRAEDRLLAVCHCRENEQRTSNAKSEQGYVYVIQS